MATLDELAATGVLVRVRVRLKRTEFEDRRFYADPGFLGWLNTDVKAARSFYRDHIAPAQQALAILQSYNAGHAFIGSRMFQRMSPSSDDIWEMRTPDLRFFGWVPTRDCFIAVKGDLFENLKNDKSLYERHRIDAKLHRADTDLDEPKYQAGAKEADIVSE
ncbi:hypothetical protein PZ895_07840 [Mesorhizobium sp. YIM 152430]|uniref:hypothetical protein n=1 Tax=Mesorhizobium sp. YIM 152430 TaxID=3031761 RepID=UPI0023DB6347|nr:hypothetical protein [Mesorhizobium sp. YIM 152430]MDF1599686.1 hypothetical protein [Mesorhizobium sp. YIM 152430]